MTKSAVMKPFMFKPAHLPTPPPFVWRTVFHDAAMSRTATPHLPHPLVPGQFLISLVSFLLALISDPLSHFFLCLAIISLF